MIETWKLFCSTCCLIKHCATAALLHDIRVVLPPVGGQNAFSGTVSVQLETSPRHQLVRQQSSRMNLEQFPHRHLPPSLFLLGHNSPVPSFQQSPSLPEGLREREKQKELECHQTGHLQHR